MGMIIALAGNPNCGKTTLFNELTGSRQHVGNWPGVTVDKKEGVYKGNKDVTILDLPGTYSLSPYSAEEIVARDYIVKDKPDAVINIVDGTSIERNLYLSLQIMETRIPMVIAMNMMDEVEAKGDQIDCQKLSWALGIPVVPIVARSGKGLKELMCAVLKAAESHEKPERMHLFGNELENIVAEIADVLGGREQDENWWKAVKLVESDLVVAESLDPEKASAIKGLIDKANKSADGDAEARLADVRYQYIGKIVGECVKKTKRGHVETKSDKMDKILTNRILALPIFAAVMYVMFACTFSENFLFIEGLPSPGVWLAGIVENIWGTAAAFVVGAVEEVGASEWAVGLVSSCLDGIGAVAGFLPLVLVLFLLLSFLEDIWPVWLLSWTGFFAISD